MKSNFPLHLFQTFFKPWHIIFLLLVFFGCNGNLSEDRGKVGTSSPPFSVVDINGNEYSLKELKGNIIVLNFWFIGCPPCIREIPELNNLVQKYKNEKIVFLAFANDSKSKLLNFLEKNKFEYNIVPKSKRMTKKFNTHGFPTNIIIDGNGSIVFHEAAYDPERVTQMDGIISSLIGQE